MSESDVDQRLEAKLVCQATFLKKACSSVPVVHLGAGAKVQ